MSGESNTSSNLGHSAATGTKPTSAPATNYAGAPEGNVSGAKGVNNPATGGGQKQPDGPAQEIAGTLPNDFTLKGMKAEYKGEDKTKPDAVTGQDGEGLKTNARGDTQHNGPLQNHEFSVPETPDRSRPRENIGDNQSTTARGK